MSIGSFALSLILGFCIPLVTLDDGQAAHCTSGCQPFIAARNGVACPQVVVTVAVLGGHPGYCECDPPTVCKKVIDCDIDLSFSFSPAGTLPGCVFDRPIGGNWGQTGYSTTIWGCGGFGESRVVGYSATCDPNVITCSAIMDVYCTKCAGKCP